MSGTLIAANTAIPQGTMNRVIGSVSIPSFRSLNVSAQYLGKQAIQITWEGLTTEMIGTLTGTVTSPNPYQMVSVQVHLLQSQNLAAQYETQRTTLATIGQITVTTASTTMPQYVFYNCAIENVAPISTAGDNADYIVTINGYYPINQNLFAAS